MATPQPSPDSSTRHFQSIDAVKIGAEVLSQILKREGREASTTSRRQLTDTKRKLRECRDRYRSEYSEIKARTTQVQQDITSLQERYEQYYDSVQSGDIEYVERTEQSLLQWFEEELADQNKEYKSLQSQLAVVQQSFIHGSQETRPPACVLAENLQSFGLFYNSTTSTMSLSTSWLNIFSELGVEDLGSLTADALHSTLQTISGKVRENREKCLGIEGNVNSLLKERERRLKDHEERVFELQQSIAMEEARIQRQQTSQHIPHRAFH
ncbi:hypothetical protein BDQ12DRAFT_135692 [Crucibulum laeve]|uniref:Uncharacterized protein n=1 Tax=Crucibulum laeve TaxID=68775 RepID=A0A5C3LZQ3_9AGAR|nr:hypothetical protein BDQ12DRAFT_135692 [Crucibulum laeve]